MTYGDIEELQDRVDESPVLPCDTHLHVDAGLTRGGMNYRSKFHGFRPGAHHGKYFHPLQGN